MKQWTKREVRTGGTVSPESVQAEMTSSQGSIATLDRSQLPAACVDTARLADYATHRIYEAIPFGSTTGEQTAVSDTSAPLNNFAGFTEQTYNGGWREVATTTLSDFKGGHLFAEWSGNAYAYPVSSEPFVARPSGSPRYVRLRLKVAGRVLIETLGPTNHEFFRVFGAGIFEQGDLTVSAEVRLTDVSYGDAIQEFSTNAPLCQAHLYSMRFLAVGRWR